MTSKYIHNFNNDGYIKISRLIDKKLVNQLFKEIELVKKKVIKKKNLKFHHKTLDGKFNTIHNINEFYKSGKLIDLSKSKKILNIIRNILKDDPKLRNLEFFLKPAKTGMPSPPHQDNYYWNIKNAKALNVWIALTGSNKNNGGIGYLKGSHKLGTINHEISFMKGSSQKIPEKIMKNLSFKIVHPKLNAGDCLIHHPEVIHFSKKNSSTYNRIGVVLSYRAKNSKIDLNKLKNYKENLKFNLRKLY